MIAGALVRILDSRLLGGCSAGLAEPTAIIDIEYSGTGLVDDDAQSRLRSAAAALRPEEPFFRVSVSDWPAAFLVHHGKSTQWNIGHWVVAFTVAMQRWSRHPVWFGSVRDTGPNQMRLAIPWYDRSAITEWAEVAIGLVSGCVGPEPDDGAVAGLVNRFRDGLDGAKAAGVSSNSFRYVQAAIERDIPFLMQPSCVQLGWGSLSERLDASQTGRLSLIASTTAKNKFATNRALTDAGLPIPAGEMVIDFNRALSVATELGWPVVIKPVAEGRGIGVVAGIRDVDTLRRAFEEAQRISGAQVIVEKHVEGDDFRLLIVRGELVAAARRTPGGVVGDGSHTIAELVEQVNADPRRVDTPDGLFRRLSLDEAAVHYLSEQGMAVDSVPAAGARVDIQRIANIAAGGTADEMTDAVHPENRLLAERAARLIGLDVAGVDFLTTDISRSWREIGGAICEVNGSPGNRVHWNADPDRDINGEVLDRLFGRRPFRIPTAAVSGGDKAAEVCAMLHRILMADGKLAGLATTSTLSVGDEVVRSGDFSGRRGGRMLISDPGVDAAVIQMPYRTVFSEGHPCDRYEVAAVISVDDTDIGNEGMDTPERIAGLHAEVLERAERAVVVNADDPRCLAMLSRAGSERRILVTRRPESVTAHRQSGGDAVLITGREGRAQIVLAAGDAEIASIPTGDVNAAYAAALAWAQGIAPATIHSGLASFTAALTKDTSPLRLSVVSQRMMPGFSAGLNERTALVEIAVEGGVDEDVYQRIRAGVKTLCPEDPLPRVSDSDWPDGFMADIPDSGLGGWVIAVTIAVQRWARLPVWRGRVVESAPNRLRLAIPWQDAPLFTDALALALRLIEQWSRPVPDAEELRRLDGYFRDGLERVRAQSLAPNTLRFIQAAVERGIPFDVLVNWVQLGWGVAAQRMDSSFTGDTGWMATVMARNKFKSSRTLADAGLPLPSGAVVGDFDKACETADDIGWPVVVKPLDQEQGTGVVPNIRNASALRRAFDAANQISPDSVIVEKHFPGDDHRLLVVHGRMIAAARRRPGGVVGDGFHTIAQLVDLINADPLRGNDKRSMLQRLTFDDEALECLDDQGLLTNSVPASGSWVPLRRTANVATGGSPTDVTAHVHPHNRKLAERAARIVGLDIAGIDFITTDITRSWREIGGVICEINAQPGFRVHWLADPNRDINGEVLDILFAGRSGRIPTAAITGTNGKTTTSMMLHHIWSTAGARAGVCTTAGVMIGRELASTDNLSGYPGARIILNDPAVEAAVFEMPRKGLIVFGHPCDGYDVAALLNVRDDHIGADGINSLEEMAQLKAQVLQRARNAVVVNAEDPLCVSMLHLAGADRKILVARDPAAVVAHLSAGGEAVFLSERDGEPWIVHARGEHETPLLPLHEIPATMGGLLRFNEENAMFAAALAFAQGVDTTAIRRALSTFSNSAEQNPGRYNFVDGLPFDVLLDYAHNPDGVHELCSIVDARSVSGRRLLCVLTVGNLHPEQFVALAPRMAESFDQFIVGCRPEVIKRAASYAGEDPVATMLSTNRQLLLQAGVLHGAITVEADPAAAVRTTLAEAEPGDLVVLLANHQDALPVIERYAAEQT